MPRNVTVTLADGSTHTYNGVPDTVTPDAINARAASDFKQSVTNIDGGRPATPAGVAHVQEPKSVGGFISNLGGDIADTAKGIWNTPGAVASAALHPVRTAQAVASAASNAKDIAEGGVQRIYDKLPAQYQGTQPRIDTSKFDDFADANYQKYGTVANALNTAYKHPLAPVATAAQIGADVFAPEFSLPATALGAAGKVADAFADTKTGQFVRKYQTAPARAMVTGEAARGEIAGQYYAGQADATAARQQADAMAATKTAAEQRLQARRAQIAAAQGDVKAQQAAAEAASAPRPLAVAEPQHLDALGGGLRAPSVEGAQEITAGMKARDTQLRAGLQEETGAQAADNIGVSDIPEAQALVAKSKALVNPEPGTAANVGGTLADSAGGKVHKEVIAALTPETVPLTAEQAATAKANGIAVNQLPDGTFTQTIKPGYEKIDNLRRHLFQIARGKVDGYSALEGQEARSLYSQVNDVLDKYSDGTHGEVQANYAAGKQALVPFDKSKVGQALTATQKGAPDFAVPASKLPALVMGGGADTANAAAAVAGEPAVMAARRSYVQNELSAVDNTSTAMQNAIRPGSTLGNQLELDPALKADVNDHIAHLLEAEGHGQRAVALGQKADMYGQHIQTIDKVASALNEKTIPDLQKASEAAAATARDYETKLANLKDLPPDQVAGKYQDLLDDLRTSGKIDGTQYAEGRALAARANDAFKDVAARGKWVNSAVSLLGGSGAVLGAHAAGVPLALGAGIVGGSAALYTGRKALQRGVGKVFKGH